MTHWKENELEMRCVAFRRVLLRHCNRRRRINHNRRLRCAVRLGGTRRIPICNLTPRR